MTRTSRTAEDKAASAAKRSETMQRLSAQLTQAVAAIQDSTAFKAYLRTQARFHQYSWRNTLLIASQCPEASHVAGYETWRGMGRQVRKGETGIRIYAPMSITTERQTAEGQITSDARTIFRPIAVFDIAQTDGDELPSFDIANLSGDQGAELYTALTQVAQAHGLTLTHDAATETPANGTYNPRTKFIYVKPQAQQQMTKTLAHELAHALDPDLSKSSRPEAETVAEGASYLVLAHFGITSDSYSFPYIADWNGSEDGQETLTRCMARIQKIAHTLIDGVITAITEADEEDDEEQAA